MYAMQPVLDQAIFLHVLSIEYGCRDMRCLFSHEGRLIHRLPTADTQGG